MKVLFLDDEAWRHEAMALMLTGNHEIFHAHDVVSFCTLLGTHAPFDLVCMDYEHGEGQNTGWHAAQAFVHPPTLCLVHSWYPEGAERIRRELRAKGHRVLVAPFSTALVGLFAALEVA